ncbi:MAG TPA: S4 domain-containing protein, partial [Candidatus Udaeobacter sp.]|nr:S4 domain-containing protein [Candidatus Udaeobacter sp.]
DDAMPLYWELLLGEPLDEGRHPNEAKRDFARRICDRFAGPGSGEEAEARFNRIHQDREIPADVPVHRIELGGDVHLPVLLREAFGVSSSEARRLLAQGAIRIDGERVAPDRLDVPGEEIADRVVQLGKRRFARVVAG